MRVAVLAVCVLAACGDDGPVRDDSIPFRVVDQAGAPITDAVTGCRGYDETDPQASEIVGTVRRVDGADYLCALGGTGGETIEISAERAGHRATLIGVERGSLGNDVVLWLPALEVEETADELVVRWDPAPALDGWIPRFKIDLDAIDLEYASSADAVELRIPIELLEDFDVDAVLAVHHDGDGVDLEQEVTAALLHAPRTPLSRGKPCTLTGRVGAVETPVTYAAGTCPLADGVNDVISCGAACVVTAATIDLGAVLPVGRVRGWGPSRLATSIDDSAYDLVDDRATLVGVTARYVRLDLAPLTGVSELSAYAP